MLQFFNTESNGGNAPWLKSSLLKTTTICDTMEAHKSNDILFVFIKVEKH